MEIGTPTPTPIQTRTAIPTPVLPNQTPETTPETEEPEVPQIDFRTNPFVIVDHDPFSTFAADVDTANHDIFRQYVSSGQLPPADRVRLEEYVNYFRYDYPIPEPDGNEPFSTSLDAPDRSTPLGRR